MNGHSSLGEALSAQAFEAALVVTPPRLQAECVAAILARRIPVLVEKPGAASGSEARELVRAADGLPVRLALSRRFWPSYERWVGRLRDLPERWDVSLHTNPDAWAPHDPDPEGGSAGLIDDLLPHAFDLASSILGQGDLRPAQAAGDGGEITLIFTGPSAGVVTVGYATRWQERLSWQAGGAEQSVAPSGPSLRRLASGLAPPLIASEPMIAIDRLLAGFASDLDRSATNEDLVRCVGLLDETKKLLTQPAR